MTPMRRLGISSVAALAVIVAGCVSTFDYDATRNPEAERAGTAYGAFLAAQYAGRVAERDAASSYFRDAMEAAPDDPYLVERAFTSALTNGDLDEAARLAELTLGDPSSDRLARVLLASRAVKDRRFQRAVDLLADTELGPFNRVVGSLVLAWAYEGLGDSDAALSALSAPGDAPILGHLMTLHRALVLERAGRQSEADAAYQAALESGLMRYLVVEAYGRRLERDGREAEARALYAAQLADFPADPAAQRGLQRIEEGRRPDAFAATPAQGASMAVFAPAATLASSSPSELAVIYLRLALYLDPENGAARQLLGDLLSRLDLDREALTVYGDAEDGSPFYVSSKIAEAWTLLRLGEDDQALASLNDLVDDVDEPTTRRALADSYRAVERYGDAYAIYDALVEEAEAARGQADWELYYARAITLERTGSWELAEADFLRALQIVPNEAQVLNYLGYTWVDRGVNLERAFGMIRRAVVLAPDSGFIVDSLGWAYFKRGEFDTAVGHLERAVELDPQDPTINEHLGDAYWRVGRQLEASYQWRRALTLEPDDETRIAIEAKLETGLPTIEASPQAFADP